MDTKNNIYSIGKGCTRSIESARHSRRAVLKSTSKALGACYLTPATIALLTAERATAQSCLPCPNTIIRDVYSYSDHPISLRYQCCQGQWTTITVYRGWNSSARMYAPHTCQATHYCGIVEDIAITARPGYILVFYDQCPARSSMQTSAEQASRP